MVAQSDAVDLYLIDREISLDIIIFFFQVVKKKKKKKSKHAEEKVDSE